MNMYDIEQIKRDLKNNLSEYRYEHSLLVAQEAKSLAHHYNLDENKAYVAGLLHDIAKEFSDEDNKIYIDKYKINSKYTTEELKPAIHSYIGAYYAEEKYGIDEEMKKSIMYHTLGHPDMDKFAKIILIADKLGRSNKDIKLDSIAYENIDKAVLYILEYQKNKLESNGKEIHEDTTDLITLLQKEE